MIDQILAGLVSGGVFALLGVCLVVMYQIVGVLSFAQAGIGGLGACAALLLQNQFGWSTVPAILGGIAAGMLIGALIGWIMARFFIDASIETRSTVTIGLLVTIMAIGNRILDGKTYRFPDMFSGATIRVGGIGLPVASVVETVLAIALALGIGLFLTRTRAGSQLRAMSQRPTTAQLLGIPVGRLTVAVWSFASGIATLALLFVLPTSTTSFPTLAYMILGALAAALLGLLRHLLLVAIGGLLIGVVQSLIIPTPFGNYTDAVPFLIIMVIMVYWRRKDVWSEAR
ncbi:branched-chain amino acid ABC transporter permease [Microbacterium sp.]|uniref:branched-chain amino acid ABC transporter permease n=1 Tax=Microbacterium sp. TaxID=51671 RepID=UPI003A88A0DD